MGGVGGWGGLCGMHLPKKVAYLPRLDSDTLFGMALGRKFNHF